MENVNPPPSRVVVWKNEEKGSDVNLALHVLNDAWLDVYDCAVIVSNDSDLAESLRLVKAQSRKIIGLVTPGAPRRKTSLQLKRHETYTHMDAAIKPTAESDSRNQNSQTWELVESGQRSVAVVPGSAPSSGLTPRPWPHAA